MGERYCYPRAGLAMLVSAVLITVTVGTGTAWALVRHTASSRARAAAHASAPPVPASSTTPADGAAATGAPTSVAPPSPSSVPTTPASPIPSGTPYRVVGLGDSVPAGSACDCTSYVTLVGRQAAEQAGRPASVDNLAVGGLTTSRLASQLRQPTTRAVVAAADLVIVTIGANDFDAGIVSDEECDAPALSCYQPVLARQAGQLDDALAQIASLRSGLDGGSVLVTGYWNVFLDGRVGRGNGTAYVANSTALTLADNALIAATSERQDATYVDIYTPFKGDGTSDDTALLAPDGDHPNAAGHRLIASALEAALT